MPLWRPAWGWEQAGKEHRMGWEATVSHPGGKQICSRGKYRSGDGTHDLDIVAIRFSDWMTGMKERWD